MHLSAYLPVVSKALATARLLTATARLFSRFPFFDSTGSQQQTHPISLFCGILLDECTPGDLLLGRSMHVKLGIILRDNHCVEFTTPGALSPVPFIVIRPIRKLAAKIRLSKDSVLRVEIALTEGAAADTSETSVTTISTVPGPHELAKYETTFPEVSNPSGRRVARTKRTMHAIDTGDAPPWRTGSNRYSPLQAIAIRLFVEQGVRDGVIKKSTSPWGFRALAVPKGGAKLPRLTAEQIQSLPTLDRLPDGIVVRICVDYRPLNKLTKKHAYPLPNVNEEIHVDASLEFIGAALYQPHTKTFSRSTSLKPSILHPVAYYCSKLSRTQQRYSAEALALTSALYKWRSWIEGLDITVLTDHESLTRLRTQKDPTAHLLRFIDKIELFDPNVVWKKGSTNVVADWLSRPPTDTTIQGAGDSVSDPIAVDDSLQPPEPPQQQSIIGPALDNLTTLDILEIAHTLLHNRPSDSRLPEAWLKKHFAAVNGTLYLVQGDKFLRVLVQANLLRELTRIHEKLGHCSAGLLLREAGKRLWSPDMRMDVSRVCLECTTCVLCPLFFQCLDPSFTCASSDLRSTLLQGR